MNTKLNLVYCVLILFFMQKPAYSDGLLGCLDQNGNLYNVTVDETPREPCSPGAVTVVLGSLSTVDVGDSLTSKIDGGSVYIDVAPDLAIPPSCPPPARSPCPMTREAGFAPRRILRKIGTRPVKYG
jgi:hypothetical protein